MVAADRAAFAQLLTATLEVYSATLTPDAIAIWWAALERYPLQQVRAGLSAHVTNPDRGRFAPKPADIIAALSDHDGRLGPEEAWALCPLDESATAVWTDEIREAFFDAAFPLICDGQTIPARMAFKEAYQRIVAAARREGSPPVWEVSLGHSASGRESAVRQAVEAGRIKVSYAQTLLPHITDWPQPEHLALPEGQKRIGR